MSSKNDPALGLMSALRPKVGLTESQQQKLAALQALDLTAIMLKMMEPYYFIQVWFRLPFVTKFSPWRWKTEVRQTVEELRRWLALFVLNPGSNFAISPRVDAALHMLLIFPLMREVEAILDCQFEHQPLDHADHQAVNRVAESYRQMIEAYDRCFCDRNAAFFPNTLSRKQLLCAGDDCRPLVPATA